MQSLAEKAKSVSQVAPSKTGGRTPINEVDKALQGVFERNLPALESTTVTVEVLGIYSLPEQWKAKAGEEDPNKYEIQCFGVKVEGGKMQVRQLTEEEKKAAEEAGSKGKKAPPAKTEKKKPEDEPSPEQKAKEEAERKAKEELEAKIQAEWDALDEDTKFYRTKEDPFKEPHMAFYTTNEEGESMLNVVTTELKEGHLALLEEFINHEGGCWLVLDKILPVEEEDPKKKKAPPKKGAVVEVEKPARGKAWLNFEALKQAGGLEIEQRIFFETVNEPPKIEPEKVEEKKEVGKGKPPAEKVEVKEEVPESVFEPNRTYAHIKIKISDPVNPILPKNGLAKPTDIIKKKPPLPRYPITKNATEMYHLQLKIASQLIIVRRIQEKIARKIRQDLKLSYTRDDPILRRTFLYFLELPLVFSTHQPFT